MFHCVRNALLTLDSALGLSSCAADMFEIICEGIEQYSYRGVGSVVGQDGFRVAGCAFPEISEGPSVVENERTATQGYRTLFNTIYSI